jgi:hypothetical protein
MSGGFNCHRGSYRGLVVAEGDRQRWEKQHQQQQQSLRVGTSGRVIEKIERSVVMGWSWAAPLL